MTKTSAETNVLATTALATKALATTAVHGGEDRQKLGDGIVDAIVPASTFTFPNTAAILDFLHEHPERDEYVRYSHYNQRVVEKKLAALDGGEDALVFTSGMSAITALLLSKLSCGDEVIVFDECYHRTRQFCVERLGKLGIVTHRVAMGDYDALKAAFSAKTRLIFSESPTNPHLSVVDLGRVKRLVEESALPIEIAIDTTIATPINYRPLLHGADYVIHSATKYMGGHNDLLAGVLVGAQNKLEDIRALRGLLGTIPAAQTCYQLQRGLKTLALRVAQQNRTGLKVAEFLEEHPKVKKVYYPGLPSHSYHDLAKELFSGYGGLVTFIIDGTPEQTSAVIDKVQLARIGPSLGGVETLIEQPYIMSYYRLTKEQRQAVGIDDSMIRLAVGIEDTDDLIADLRQALTAL